MLGKLCRHPRTMDLALDSVVKDVQAHRSSLKIAHPDPLGVVMDPISGGESTPDVSEETGDFRIGTRYRDTMPGGLIEPLGPKRLW
ncbi:hypothetical protein [Brachybacterium alimentarium]|uniref:hypothetical protein n=1 Tax=Brachybacterium alimentarium TaxID=47845 RepID=UPI003FD0B30B